MRRFFFFRGKLRIASAFLLVAGVAVGSGTGASTRVEPEAEDSLKRLPREREKGDRREGRAQLHVEIPGRYVPLVANEYATLLFRQRKVLNADIPMYGMISSFRSSLGCIDGDTDDVAAAKQRFSGDIDLIEPWMTTMVMNNQIRVGMARWMRWKEVVRRGEGTPSMSPALSRLDMATKWLFTALSLVLSSAKNILARSAILQSSSSKYFATLVRELQHVRAIDNVRDPKEGVEYDPGEDYARVGDFVVEVLPSAELEVRCDAGLVDATFQEVEEPTGDVHANVKTSRDFSREDVPVLLQRHAGRRVGGGGRNLGRPHQRP
ncbi:hypothetical protein IL306_001800 [Fusarium sp. DS 682]|nr:hypothetical protein IL306_001800 [Fusarium sp. DS 682]